MAKSEGAVCHLSVCLLVCSSTLEQNIPSLFQVCLNWSWFAEMLQKTVSQIHIEESQVEPEIPACDWFTLHWGRQSSPPHLCFTSELAQQLSDSTPGRQGYDAKLVWRWRRKKSNHLLTHRLSGKVWFLILWSSSAWALRGLLLCRWTPLLSFISCFPGCREQSQSRFTALLYTEITSKLGRKEIKVAFSSVCVIRVLPSPLNTSLTADRTKKHTSRAQGKITLKCQTT